MLRRTFLSATSFAIITVIASVPLQAWMPEEIPGMHYPRLARAAGLEGVVTIECTINLDGTVNKTAVKSGHPVLGKAAADAAKAWRFRPSGDDSDKSTVELVFEFRLEGVCKNTQSCDENFVLHYPNRIVVTSELPSIQPSNPGSKRP